MRAPRLRCPLWAALALLLLASTGAAAQSDALLGEARALVDAGRAEAAYRLLVPHLDRRAGDPGYDYVLGLAALDAGNVTEAVFAFERVLAVEPDHPQARAELARALFRLGELDDARAEFEAVQRTSPPPQVRATIERYLAEIERRQGGPPRTQLRGHLSLTAGFDTNVNSAQDDRILNVPLFAAQSTTGNGLAQLNPSGISQKDNFGQAGAGLGVFHRLGPQAALVANAHVVLRNNDSQEQFATGDLSADLGITWQRGQDTFTTAAQASRFLLDGDTFRDAYGAFGQWRRTLDADTSATGYVQYTALTYDTQRIRNANRYTVGGAYTRALGGRYDPTVNLGIYGGIEEERASGVEHLGHRFAGASAAASLELSPATRAFASAAVESRHYGGRDPFFLVGREDTFVRLRGGFDWTFRRAWHLLPQVHYSYNDSNVALNDYDRFVLSVTLRRDFQ